MKKIIMILLLLPVGVFSQESSTKFAISSGTEYLDNDFYFNFGVSTIFDFGVSKEFDLKLAMNLKTGQDSNGEIIPMFNIPLKLNINFLFPINEKFTFLTGVGLSPTIRLTGKDNGFIIGPNIKAGIRYKIHPTMSVFTEISQSLLIGPPKWMYPSTEMVLGVNFFI